MTNPAKKMDKTMTWANHGIMSIAEGFPGQKLVVVPRPRTAKALQRPGTSQLVVTDCGYFPQAKAHGRSRSAPLDEAIIMICTSGTGWCEVLGRRHHVHSGDAVILPPGLPHSYGSDESDPWTLWWLHAGGMDLDEVLRIGGMTAQAPVRRPGDLFRAVSLLEEVVATLERDASPTGLLAASGAAWHLLTLLAADVRVETRTQSIMEQAKEYMRTHLAEKTSVADLAGKAGMSPSHFAATFRQQVGFPVLKFHTELRMARARHLLDTTDQPVAAIARSVGYPDPFYFSRQFRAIHQTTPLRYRAQRKG